MIDVMFTGMRIWSPSVLTRKDVEKDANTGEEDIQLTVVDGKYESRDKTRIMMMCPHPSTPTVYVGKENGEVIAFNATTGISTILYSHSHALKKLAVSRNDMIACADNLNGVVLIWELSPVKATGSNDSHPLIRIYTRASVKQLLFSADGKYLLMATVESDNVYLVKDGSCIGTLDFRPKEREKWKWLLPPRRGQGEQGFWLLSDGIIKSFSAESFPSLSTSILPELHLEYTPDAAWRTSDYETATVDPSSAVMALEVHHDSIFGSASMTFLYDLEQVNLLLQSSSTPPLASSDPITLEPMITVLQERCKHFLGFSERSNSIVFLNKDSWVSSIPLSNLTEMRYTQHFFVPADHLPRYWSDKDLPPVKTADDGVVFFSRGELVCVRDGLRFSSTKTVE